MRKVLLVALLCAALGGCETAKSVTAILGSPCELPAELDQHDAVTDLDPTIPISRDQADVLWAKDRSHLAKSVKKGNDTVDYVHAHCQ